MGNNLYFIGNVDTKKYDSKYNFVKSSSNGYKGKYESESFDVEDTSLKGVEKRSTSSGSNARTISRYGRKDSWETEDVLDVWLSNDTADWEKGYNNGKPYWTNKNDDSVYIYKDFDTFYLVIDGEEYEIPKEINIKNLEKQEDISYTHWIINEYMYVEKRWEGGYNFVIDFGNYKIRTILSTEDIDESVSTSSSTSNLNENNTNINSSQENSSSSEVLSKVHPLVPSRFPGIKFNTNHKDSVELCEDVFKNANKVEMDNDVVIYTKCFFVPEPRNYHVYYYRQLDFYVLCDEIDPYNFEVFKVSSDGKMYKYGNGKSRVSWRDIPGADLYDISFFIETSDKCYYYHSTDSGIISVECDFEYNGKKYTCSVFNDEVLIELKSEGRFDNELEANKNEIADKLGLFDNVHWAL